MSFNLPGLTWDSVLELPSAGGLPTSTGAATISWWVKRTGTMDGRKYVVSIRTAWAGFITGHGCFVNSTANTIANGFQVDAHYGSAEAVINEEMSTSWMFCALVGSSSNWSLKVWDTDTSAFLTATVGQTPFGPTTCYFGGDWGSPQLKGKFAHIRVWNVALTDAELVSEKNSETRVRESGSRSVFSGGGGSLAVAKTGQFGGPLSTGDAVTYDADMPSFSTFTGTVISGTALMPLADPVTTVTVRENRILWSDNLLNSVWANDGHSIGINGMVPAPAGHGVSYRLTLTSTSGGYYQPMNNLPAGGGGMSQCVVRRVNCDRFTLRHLGDNATNGSSVVFNIQAGTIQSTIFHGNTTGAGVLRGIRSLGNGWWLVYLGVINGISSTNRVIGFYPTSNDDPPRLITGNAIDFAGPQYETNDLGQVATAYKPTQGAVVTRTLTTIDLSLSSATAAIGQTIQATVQLLDGAGAPWDQFGPTGFISSNTAVAEATVSTEYTDFSGRNVASVLGTGVGTSNITATAAGAPDTITSSAKTVTVSGTVSPRIIDVRVEYGWGNTSGWFAGVYEKHASQRFPGTKLFEASGQSFIHWEGQSQMKIAVPGNVTLTAGTTVEVVLENDNINGAAVDGPGIFTATVI